MVSQKAKAQRLSPGLIALVLVAVLAFSLSFSFDREETVLDLAYGQVMVVVCGQGYGTGWFVNNEYALTAFHVVQECLQGNVTLVRGEWSSVGRVAAYDPVNDMAVIRVDNPPRWAKGIPLTKKVAVGDPVYVIGYPIQLYTEAGKDVKIMSEIPRVASGTVSWLHPSRPIFQFDIPTDAGNSGGPVVSKETGGAVGLVIYARPGVVSEGYFGLRMDYVARFLESHGIEYRVAGGRGLAFYLGLGFVVVLLFFMIKSKGVKGMRRVLPVLFLLALFLPVSAAEGQAYLVVGVDIDSSVGGQWRAVPLCTVGYDLPDVPGLQQPVILVAENRYTNDNWAIYHGYRMYNDIYGGYVYTVTQKIVELPFDDDKLYRPPAGAIHARFYFVVGPNGEVMVNDDVIGQVPCQKVTAAYGDGVATRVLPWNWTVPSPILPGPDEPPVNTTTPQPPGGDEAAGDVLSVSPFFLGLGALAGLLLAMLAARKGW